MLLADIGGTYVRFATLHADGRIDAIETWLTSLYPDFRDGGARLCRPDRRRRSDGRRGGVRGGAADRRRDRDDQLPLDDQRR